MRKFISHLAFIGLTFLTLATQEGKVYQFSPNTLKTRDVKTYHLPVLHIPVYRKVCQEREYMLCPLWRKLRLLPEFSKKSESRWVNSLSCTPDARNIQGPAYALLDIRTVGSPEYWERFAAAYPREAKKLFRRVIVLLKSGNIEWATALLAESAWMRIPV